MKVGVQRGALLLGPQHMVLLQGTTTATTIKMIRPNSSSSNSSSGASGSNRNGSTSSSSRAHEHMWALGHYPSLLVAAAAPSPQGGGGSSSPVADRLYSRIPSSSSLTLPDPICRAQTIRGQEQPLQYVHIRPSVVAYRMDCEISGLSLYAGGQFIGRSGIIDSHNTQRGGFTSWRSTHKVPGLQSGCSLLKSGEVFLQSQGDDPALPKQCQVSGKAIQEFDYVVVIDFEATCNKNMESLKPQEIIEFPSVLLNCHCLTVEDSFQTYVKPVHHPILTEFCTQLTGIQQEQVDGGIALGEALDRHDKWLEEKGVKNKKFAVLIWSDWDCKVMLESECRLKGLEKPAYFNSWINLKVLFQNAFVGRKCNLRKAVELAGLKWLGRAHCGLDDAKNTARLALELMRRGTVLSVTGSLETTVEGRSMIFVAKLRRPEFPGSKIQATSDNNNMQCVNGTLIDLGKVDANCSQCYCGIRCKRRMVKKPGPTYGKFFFGCGKWSMTDGSQCNFFQWIAA